ncbi:hypothetical protein COO60DRAFT_388995 [Scenedesmus sp. NREL 46B-D3]|nr:hypothetical protein COO60DRAFT_388995 [Scenedesmus sp. NREL 46B-D3]
MRSVMLLDVVFFSCGVRCIGALNEWFPVWLDALLVQQGIEPHPGLVDGLGNDDFIEFLEDTFNMHINHMQCDPVESMDSMAMSLGSLPEVLQPPSMEAAPAAMDIQPDLAGSQESTCDISRAVDGGMQQPAGCQRSGPSTFHRAPALLHQGMQLPVLVQQQQQQQEQQPCHRAGWPVTPSSTPPVDTTPFVGPVHGGVNGPKRQLSECAGSSAAAAAASIRKHSCVVSPEVLTFVQQHNPGCNVLAGCKQSKWYLPAEADLACQAFIDREVEHMASKAAVCPKKRNKGWTCTREPMRAPAASTTLLSELGLAMCTTAAVLQSCCNLGGRWFLVLRLAPSGFGCLFFKFFCIKRYNGDCTVAGLLPPGGASDPFVASKVTAETTSNCLFNWMAERLSWLSCTRQAVEMAATEALTHLCAEHPAVNCIKNTKGALGWQEVDLMFKALDRWECIGHINRFNRYWALAAKAVLAVGEYSGLRPFCTFRQPQDRNDLRWNDTCPFTLGQVHL